MLIVPLLFFTVLCTYPKQHSISVENRGQAHTSCPRRGWRCTPGHGLQEEVSGTLSGLGLTPASLGGDKALPRDLASKIVSESWGTESGAWQDQGVDQALDMPRKPGR